MSEYECVCCGNVYVRVLCVRTHARIRAACTLRERLVLELFVCLFVVVAVV